MDNLNSKKALIIILVLLIVVLITGFSFYLWKSDSYLKNLNQQLETQNNQPLAEEVVGEEEEVKDEDIPNQEVFQYFPEENLSEEDKELIKNEPDEPVREEIQEDNEIIKNIIGRFSKVSLNFVEVLTDSGGKFSLKVPPKGAFFYQQVESGDGVVNKEIGLLEVPLDKELEIQYNQKTNELNKVIVK